MCQGIDGCLREGTLIVMANGSIRPIESVGHDDTVLAFDPAIESQPSPRRVATRVTTHNTRLVRLGWDVNGDGTEDGSASATIEHPFWTQEQGWRQAQSIQPGWHLRTDHGQNVTVSSATVVDGAVTTYNLDIETANSFFVWSNGTAVLVHNGEKEVYPYGYPTSPKGMSQEHLKINGEYVPQFVNGVPKMVSNQEHHFYYNAWLRENWPGSYFSYRSPFPSVELSNLDHKITQDAGRDWFRNNHPLGREPKGAEWKQVSKEQMEQVADYMVTRIGLEKKKINKLKQQANGFMDMKLKAGGCMKP